MHANCKSKKHIENFLKAVKFPASLSFIENYLLTWKFLKRYILPVYCIFLLSKNKQELTFQDHSKLLVDTVLFNM